MQYRILGIEGQKIIFDQLLFDGYNQLALGVRRVDRGFIKVAYGIHVKNYDGEIINRGDFNLTLPLPQPDQKYYWDMPKGRQVILLVV